MRKLDSPGLRPVHSPAIVAFHAQSCCPPDTSLPLPDRDRPPPRLSFLERRVDRGHADAGDAPRVRRLDAYAANERCSRSVRRSAPIVAPGQSGEMLGGARWRRVFESVRESDRRHFAPPRSVATGANGLRRDSLGHRRFRQASIDERAIEYVEARAAAAGRRRRSLPTALSSPTRHCRRSLERAKPELEARGDLVADASAVAACSRLPRVPPPRCWPCCSCCRAPTPAAPVGQWNPESRRSVRSRQRLRRHPRTKRKSGGSPQVTPASHAASASDLPDPAATAEAASRVVAMPPQTCGRSCRTSHGGGRFDGFCRPRLALHRSRAGRRHARAALAARSRGRRARRVGHHPLDRGSRRPRAEPDLRAGIPAAARQPPGDDPARRRKRHRRGVPDVIAADGQGRRDLAGARSRRRSSRRVGVSA